MYAYRDCLVEEEIERLVTLVGDGRGENRECPHMDHETIRWETKLMHTRQRTTARVRMCCDCYQLLRQSGFAPVKGTWEGR
jgi:hypothetical protein